MSGPTTSIWATPVVAVMLTSCSVTSVSERDAGVDQRAAAEAQSQLLGSLEREDQLNWMALTTADFTALEGGKAIDRQALFGLVGAAHRNGTHFVWTVTDVKIRSSKSLFVMSYRNVGKVIKSGAAQPMEWLETAAFRYEDAQWRAFLLTSERVAQ